MDEQFKKLFSSKQDIKNDILKSFAIEFLQEMEKLVSVYGKEEIISRALDDNSQKYYIK